MPDIRSSLFGQLALSTGKVTAAQVEDCLRYQAECEQAGKRVPRLGEILASKGVLSPDQVRTLLRQQKAAPSPVPAPDPVVQAAAEKPAGPAGPTGPTEADAKGGETFGQFKILKRLGADAVGYTYKARYLPADSTVTLRVLSRQTMEEDAEFVRRFETQIRKATELKHEGIQRVVAAGRLHGRDYYAAEYIEGISLKQVLVARGKLDVPFALDLAVQIARAFEYGHARGVFHLEVRPSNLLVTTDRKVKLVAYGAARDVIGNLRHLAAGVDEMPFYVAPEQAIGKGGPGAGDARTDLYCLGVVLYQMLTGQAPFQGSSVEEVLLDLAEREVPDPTLLNPDLPAALVRIVLSLMNPEPDKRYQSATHLLQDLQNVAAEPPSAKGGTKVFAGQSSTLVLGPRSAAAGAAVHQGSSSPRKGGREKEKDGKEGRAVKKKNNLPMVLLLGGAVFGVALIGLYFAHSRNQKVAEERRALAVKEKAEDEAAAKAATEKAAADQEKSAKEKAEKDEAAKEEAAEKKKAAKKKPAPKKEPAKAADGSAPAASADAAPAGTAPEEAKPAEQPAEPAEESAAPADGEKPPVPTWMRDFKE